MDHDKIGDELTRIRNLMTSLADKAAADLPDSESSTLTVYQQNLHFMVAALHDGDFSAAWGAWVEAENWKDSPT